MDDNSLHIFKYFPVIQNHQAVLMSAFVAFSFYLLLIQSFPSISFCIQQLPFDFGSGMLVLRDREPLSATLLKVAG